MIDKIYPICYIGGSGGMFLSAWLNQALNGAFYGTKVVLNNENGNAHQSGKYGGFSLLDDPQIGIENLKFKFSHFNDQKKKVFVACHILQNKIILSNFLKSIKVVYDPSDRLEISISFCTKAWEPTIANIKHRLDFMEKFQDIASCKLPETLNSTNINWKLLLHNDPNLLIEKLSSFYNIEKNKFDYELLKKWRKCTLHNIYSAPKF